MRWEIDPDPLPFLAIAGGRGTRLLYGGGLEYRFPSGLGVGGELRRSDLDYRAVRAIVSFRF
jgi:hypothetical protein